MQLALTTDEVICFVQDLYCVRSDLGNLLKALGRLDEAKVCKIVFVISVVLCLWFVLFLSFVYVSLLSRIVNQGVLAKVLTLKVLYCSDT